MNHPSQPLLDFVIGYAVVGVGLLLFTSGCKDRQNDSPTENAAAKSSPASEVMPVTLASLLAEMADSSAVARWPQPEYRSLQASSYNRSSTNRRQANQDEWFANRDGSGFIRAEENEWVVMEHDGPGCITKVWAPFFHYDFNNRKGPNIRIYLDGDPQAVVDENFIALISGLGSIPSPFAGLTVRAGNSYFPIPFAKKCKVTFTGKPYYHIINYRAYAADTQVETFQPAQVEKLKTQIESTGQSLLAAEKHPAANIITRKLEIDPQHSRTITLPAGPSAIAWFSVALAGAPDSLRSTILKLTFDGEQTIWCPVGDFFCSADAVHPFHTLQRTVAGDGTMTCRWLMPYRTTATLELENLGQSRVAAQVDVGVAPWTWDDRSMHFHARWRPDDILPALPVVDWNFIDIRGQGVYVGDAWTVLNPTNGWWGEGDEKIYVDGAWKQGFPSHFGTGAEDYYGWAGGVVPTRADEFGAPFLANVRVGGVDGSGTLGFNINTRSRLLDAIPFTERLRFDMETAPGLGLGPTDNLGYSAVTFWYARPGATHNRPPQPLAAGIPIMSLANLTGRISRATTHDAHRQLIEFEHLQPSVISPGMEGGPQVIKGTLPPYKWSGGAQYWARATRTEESLTFELPSENDKNRLILHPTQSYDFGTLNIYVNDTLVAENWDGYAKTPRTGDPMDLGEHSPEDGRFRLKLVVAGKNPAASGYSFGLDAIAIEDPEESETHGEVREFFQSDVFDERPARDWPRLIGLVKRPWGTSALAILWNPGSSDQAVTLDFASAGLDPQREYAIWSFRDSRFLGYAKGSWVSPMLPATGSMILRITEIDRSRNTPTLVGSTLHKYCGADEIKRLDFGHSDLSIELSDIGAREGALFVYSPFALARQTATGCSVETVESMGENIWKIHVNNREPEHSQHIRMDLILPLTQRPSSWMILGVILATVVFAIWWSVHRHRCQLILARLEHQNAMEIDRLRIARDIHDEVGSNLTKISELISSMEQPAFTQPARPILRDLAETTRTVIQSMDEIVWAVNPRNDSLENMANYLVHYTGEFLRPTGIACEFDVPILLPAMPIPAEVRHNLFLTVKEALNNAVKHSEARNIRICLAYAHDTLTIEVSDDGCGFNPQHHDTGADGLENMRHRLAAIGGYFDLQTSPGRGTTVTLRVPLAESSKF